MAIINYNDNEEYHWWLLELFQSDLSWYFHQPMSGWYSGAQGPELTKFRNSIIWC